MSTVYFHLFSETQCWSEKRADLLQKVGPFSPQSLPVCLLLVPTAWPRASLSTSATLKQTTLVWETATLLSDWMVATFISKFDSYFTVKLRLGLVLGFCFDFLYAIQSVLGFQSNTSLQNPMMTGPWSWWPGVHALSWRNWRILSLLMVKVTSSALFSRGAPSGLKEEQGVLFYWRSHINF